MPNRLRNAVFFAAITVSVGSVYWVNYSPFMQKPVLVYGVLLFLWLAYTAVRALRRRGKGAFGVMVAITLLAALFSLTTSLWVDPLWKPTFTVSPVPVGNIVDISRFRSCAGHDYSGAAVGSPGENETDRSMKHYLSLGTRYGDGVEVQVRAMADGVVTNVVTQSEVSTTGDAGGNGALGAQGNFAGELAITMSNVAAFGYWELRYMHVAPTVKQGQRVKAGDVVATAPPSDWRKVVDADGKAALLAAEPVQFDVALSFHPLLPMGNGEASYIRYLSAPLARAYEAKGFSASSTYITKSERDARPCSQRFNADPGADWVNADSARREADNASSGSNGGAGPTSTLPNNNNGQTSNPNDPFADRPVCNSAILGAQWQAADGATYVCMTTAEGKVAWGPGVPATTMP